MIIKHHSTLRVSQTATVVHAVLFLSSGIEVNSSHCLGEIFFPFPLLSLFLMRPAFLKDVFELVPAVCIQSDQTNPSPVPQSKVSACVYGLANESELIRDPVDIQYMSMHLRRLWAVLPS